MGASVATMDDAPDKRMVHEILGSMVAQTSHKLATGNREGHWRMTTATKDRFGLHDPEHVRWIMDIYKPDAYFNGSFIVKWTREPVQGPDEFIRYKWELLSISPKPGSVAAVGQPYI